MPYRFYYTFQKEGVQSAYFLATYSDKKLFDGLPPADSRRGAIPFWKSVHVQNFKLEIPFQDVTYKLFPSPDLYKSRSLPNFDIVDHQMNRVVRAQVLETDNFKTAIPMDKIFNLPIITKVIKNTSNQQIWLDVLNLNLRIKEVNLLSLNNIKSLLNQYPISRLGYHLYIYKLREKLFGHNTTSVVQNGPFHIMIKTEVDNSNSFIDLFLGI